LARLRFLLPEYSEAVLIGLTGGIASGKTTVANRWAELGAEIIDADELAREVVAPGSEGLREIATSFGSNFVQPDGTLNRALLADTIFMDADKRRLLEAITHPRIRQLALQRLSAAGDRPVVYVIPLLVESASTLPFDTVVTVSAPESVRLDRMIKNRGLSPELAQARLGAQASDSEREAVANHVINSDCSLAELIARADNLWAKLTAAGS
jgi:dephospho-CoA kinase